MSLPTRWNNTRIQHLIPSEVIYGFTYNVNKTSYCLYLTNFKDVWTEALGKIEFLKKTVEYGIEDLNEKRTLELFELLDKGIQDGIDVQKSETAQDELIFNTTLHLPWTFNLTKSSSEKTIQFFAQLNFQQFSNHRYLQEQLHHLKLVVAVKDTYIKFLYENLKQSHGLDLIDKFKKNNKLNRKYFTAFEVDSWQKDFEKHASQKTSSELLKLSIHDVNTWQKSAESVGEAELESEAEISGPYFTSPLKEDSHNENSSESPTKRGSPNLPNEATIKDHGGNLLETPILKPPSDPVKKKRKLGSLPTKRQKKSDA